MIAVSGRGGTDASRAGTGAHEETVPDGHPVVYPVFDAWSARRLDLAFDLAAGASTDLYVVDAATDRTAPEVQTRADEHRVESGDYSDVDVYGVAPDGDAIGTVRYVVERYDAGLLLLGGETPGSLTDVVRGDVTRQVPCDAVVVNQLRETPTVASILVPVADGPHSGVSVRVAGALARATGAWVELLHVSVNPDADGAQTRARELFADGRTHVPPDVHVDTWHLEAEDVVAAISEQSRHYDVTVVGSPQKGRLRRLLFGSTAGEVTSAAENTVLTARQGDVRFL
jgi:nucleotide-binding universal stress UspA family protein